MYTKPDYNPVICALDTAEVDHAVALAKLLVGKVGMVKLGLEFFTANGVRGMNAVAETGIPIFLDLKFHDIPNTVLGAVRALVEHECAMMTLHASGGADMLKASVEIAHETADKLRVRPPLLLAVTVLTSMDENDLKDIGAAFDTKRQVQHLGQLAHRCGVDGLVCSPHEIGLLRLKCGYDIKLVVPGIRPQNAGYYDQKRVTTPKDAIERGANYLVIGRPITKADDPAAAAVAILQELGIEEQV